LISIREVSDNDDLMIINKSGIAIRMEIENLRVMGRATQGVKLITLKDKDSIAAISVIKDGKQQRLEDEESAFYEDGESQISDENATNEGSEVQE
jgi:DNA gyrase subunit A